MPDMVDKSGLDVFCIMSSVWGVIFRHRVSKAVDVPDMVDKSGLDVFCIMSSVFKTLWLNRTREPLTTAS